MENAKQMKVYKCKNGSFVSERGACERRGGGRGRVVNLTPQYVNRFRRSIQKNCQSTPSVNPSKLAVVDVPLSDVFVNTTWFQNRKDSFSLRSVDNIVEAAKGGSFRWSNFDPIVLWLNPDDKRLYILSGHSRTEAFSRLAAQRVVADGRGFDSIPAKIERNLSLESAKKIALDSNTLSTKETDIERATYYRNFRISENPTKSDLEKAARRDEGANASKILALSYLNPNGKTLSALALLQSAQDTSRQNIMVVAKWIGEARQRHNELTNSHENELYDWLIGANMYGTKSGQLSNEREFLNRLQSVITRRTEFGVFQSEKPLNLENSVTKSPTEQEYDRQILALQSEIKDLEKDLKEKITDYARRGASEKQIAKITEGVEATLRRKRIEYQNLLLARRFRSSPIKI